MKLFVSGRPALVGATLFASLTTHAAIIDLGTITRDTDAGLDWLDVTESRGLSYNDVTAQLGAGGTYDGWRYDTFVIYYLDACNYAPLFEEVP